VFGGAPPLLTPFLPPVILQAHDDEALATLVAEEASIKTLCGKGVEQIEIVRPGEARPAGCVAYPVSSALAVFLYVRGRVDMDAEIGKAAKKLDKVRAALDKQRRAVADDTYLEKATANVQQADRLRITSLEAEARTFEGTIEQFERLKLE
jgi:valyl-tRNA synthetase